MKEKGVSIIICCYNSANRLPITLAYLSRQKVEEEIPWEIIIVDNKSTDNTVQVARQLAQDLNLTNRLSIVFEPIPGLSHARDRGIASATNEYVILCDDDNWLFENYVTYSFSFLEKNRDVGIVGGLGEGNFDAEPPTWFHTFQGSYAIGPQDKISIDVTKTRGYVFGAGMVLRKSAWIKLNNIGFKSLLTDRKGESLSSGGDTELCYAVSLIGYRIWYLEQLRFFHHITSSRITLKYLYALNKGFAESQIVLRLYRLETEDLQKKWFWSREIFYFLRTDLIQSLWRFLTLKTGTIEHFYYHKRLYYYWTLLRKRKFFNDACTKMVVLKDTLRHANK